MRRREGLYKEREREQETVLDVKRKQKWSKESSKRKKDRGDS